VIWAGPGGMREAGVAASKNEGERESLKKESEVEDDDTIEKVVVVV
jgi:hypothetical protein